GTFDVKLTVVDSLGGTASDTVVVKTYLATEVDGGGGGGCSFGRETGLLTYGVMFALFLAGRLILRSRLT
ncbi:MAG: hypothetical protein GXN94_02180, partial [Aquificae bacterium]|nr:hypothetical protein [Aquificota bacterium]